MVTEQLSKKQTVIARLYALCQEKQDMNFSNDEVKAIASEVGFGNPFDATKLDSSRILPNALVQDDVLIVHTGRGRHRFVRGIATVFHQFEEIPEESCKQWSYRRSILNNINTSESNILSVGYNQRIIHDFLYEDIAASPKLYGSNRTHIPVDYRIGDESIDADRMQVEIDLTLEHNGAITAFEAKNGQPADFNVFQLFNPFRYYQRVTADADIRSIQCCYLVRRGDRLRLYLYSFSDSQDPGSIQLVKNAEYTLMER